MQSELLQALATIADLKEQNYRLWLSLSSLTEALVARGLLSYPELAGMASSLEAADTAAAFPPVADAAFPTAGDAAAGAVAHDAAFPPSSNAVPACPPLL